MQSEQQVFSQKPTLPLADQLGGGYMHNAPIAPFLGIVPPIVQKHLLPFQGIDLKPTDACPRNFIICDQTDKRTQVMFHPAINLKFCYPGKNFSFPSFQGSAKRNDVNDDREISYLKENSDDIDALLSFEEEEEEECDEEEVSTARTHGNCGSDSPVSCFSHGSRSRKRMLPSLSQKSTSSGSNRSRRKRHKMNEMVKELRRIVPGGDRMNAVTVLDEAVRYLKSLKDTLQVYLAMDSWDVCCSALLVVMDIKIMPLLRFSKAYVVDILYSMWMDRSWMEVFKKLSRENSRGW